MIQVTMTPAQFAAKQTELAAEGLVLAGNAGMINHAGCAATFAYDGATLTVTVTHAPFLVPKSVVESKVRAFLTS
jgi:hypothetical protein